ncbi:MAG: hypothetical protein ABR553_11325, partial [Gammaproteobacteria bacterium]
RALAASHLPAPQASRARGAFSAGRARGALSARRAMPVSVSFAAAPSVNVTPSMTKDKDIAFVSFEEF